MPLLHASHDIHMNELKAILFKKTIQTKAKITQGRLVKIIASNCFYGDLSWSRIQAVFTVSGLYSLLFDEIF